MIINKNIRNNSKFLNSTIFFQALFILMLTSITGCVSLKQPSPKIDYYSLDYSARTMNEDKAPLPLVLKIQRFSVSPEFNTDRITYQEHKNSLASYTYHRWRANPADLVTYYLGRDLQKSNLFLAVLPPSGRTQETHILEGTVNQFFESDLNDWQAVISITLTLLRSNEPDPSKRILLQKTFSSKERCVEKHPRSVAKAMAQAMAQISEQVANTIYQTAQ